MDSLSTLSNSTTTEQSTVSFVIPHKGRQVMLIDTLKSIALLNANDFIIDVIVVTKNTNTLDIPHDIINNITLHILHAPDNVTISTQRNMGVAHSNAQYLAFIDADIELEPNWLTVLFNILHEQNKILVSAHQRAPSDAKVLEHIRTSLSNVEMDTNLTFLPGRNLFLRREDFDKVGGFPEHLSTCEDYYFTQRLSEFGACFYSSKTSYIHLGEDKILHEMYQKEIWRGQSNIASIRGRKIPIREYPSFVIPVFLTTTLIIALGSWGMVLGSQSPIWYFMSLMATIGFSIPFFAYCLRLLRIVPKHISIIDVMSFYAVYFPARAIGTIRGAFHSITTDSHA